MVAAFVAGLQLPVSSVRLASYRPPNGSDLEMLVNYMWNMELSEALYPTLQALEVGLRNAIHSTASAHYRTEFWFDLPGVLLRNQVTEIAKAREKLTKAQRPHTAGRIVAALTFGFWTSLLNRPYQRLRPSANRLAWHDVSNRPALLIQAFPYIPRRYKTLGAVYERFDDARELRNRVFHHEPVWNRPYLQREHRLILHAVGWISPQMEEVISLCDRFPDVFQHGKARIESAVRAHLQIP